MLGSYKKDISHGCYTPCEICFDTMELQTMPVTLDALRDHSVHYTPDRVAAAPIRIDALALA
jgi:hypothetical protein